MTAYESEYSTLRSLSVADRPAWIEGRYPTGPGIQWWLSMVGSAETEAIACLRSGESALDAFEFAVSLLERGTATGGVTRAWMAYWLMRLAALAIKFNVASDGLPEQLLPDKSAEIALTAIPVDLEAARPMLRTLGAESPGEADRAPNENDRVVAEIALIVPTLDWIREEVSNRELQRLIDLWRDAYAEGGTTDPG
ncbi:MAG TPA: hypothetical protein VFT95_20030 [Micromonosporaceae bacterium]|nr:hypothetical protein [Micromonosporaceae bacterium]